jgi:tRNA 2-thiouridine synthesizing protein A
MKFDQDLNAVGLLCPLPVLKARKRLMGLQIGQILRLQSDDPAAVIDVPHYCAEAGHQLLSSHNVGNSTHFFIQKM